MKKMSMFLLLFLSLIINSFAENTDEKFQIISIETIFEQEELKDLATLSFDEQIEKLEQFFDNWQDNWVIEFTKGLELPLKLNVKGDIFHLEPQDNFVSIFIDRNFYFRVVGEEDILLSTDLTNWMDIEEFFTGEVDVRCLKEKDKPFINLMLELNQR